MSHEMQRLLTGLILAFGAIAAVALYWTVIAPAQLLDREDNPRLFEARAAIERGLIVDRDDEPLAVSVREPNNRVRREYPYPATYSALGYYSLRYGVGGAEAAYDTLLNGDALPNDDAALEALLHRPQQGVDVRLTLDLDVQRELVTAMQGQQGAAVVLSVPDGAVLGMVSLPTYDPNRLDDQWEALREAPGDPIFNRVLQGRYQPGGVMYTLLMLTALIEGQDIEAITSNADAPVRLGDVTLTCTQPPPTDTLTLADAYRYGCPAPFRQLVESIELETTFGLFQLETPPRLAGFIPEVESTPEPTPDGNITMADALGQGDITLNPLQVASLIAAIINNGNAPQPHILAAIRLPDSDTWDAMQTFTPTTPITTPGISRQMQAFMRSGAEDLGGQAARAFTGETINTWYIGFARLDVQEGVVVALVLEDTDDIEAATRIGEAALRAMTPAD